MTQYITCLSPVEYWINKIGAEYDGDHDACF